MFHWNSVGFSFTRSQFVKTSTQLLLVFAVLVSLVASAVNVSPTRASGSLTIEPLTWNVIGLDSNLVTVGPEHFPIGARVCNTSVSASTVSVTYNWTDGLNKYTGDTYINLRAGTLDVVSLSIPTGQCKDAYFEVAVTRNSSAYNKTRAYTITANDGAGGTATTTTPRELLVEHLISQSRNSVTDMQLSSDGSSYSSVAPGGTMTLMVGQTYWIKLVGSTATNGYEQIETFINFPNTIFQVESVVTTYMAESSATLNPPYDKLYGDGCVWENNPLSPNYRSCLSTGKAGGDITVTYQVKIISVPSTPLVNPEPLSTLIYDFSGSSYHYNADYGVSTRFVYVLDPTTLIIDKSFTPDAVTPGGISKMTIRIPNPTTSSLTGVNFLDDLPDTSQTPPAIGNMVVASTPNLSYTGCGASPSPASVSSGDGSISFSNIEIAANSTCIIKVDVTVPATPTSGVYTNTTGHLFINGTTPGTGTDTGNFDSANLTVGSNALVCTTDVIMANWSVPTTATQPPDAAGGIPGAYASNVGTPTALGVSSGVMNFGIEGAPKWPTGVWSAAKTPTLLSAGDYFRFALDTSKYKDITWSFKAGRANTSSSDRFVLYYLPNGGTKTQIGGNPFGTPFAVVDTLYSFSTTFSGYFAPGSTTFYIHPYTGPGNGQNDKFVLDDIVFTGTTCAPPWPTLQKSFGTDPIEVNTGVSTLTFTIANTSVSPSSEALTGVNFSDTLPSGLVIATPANVSTTCSSGVVSATAGGSTLSLSGANMAAGSICYVYVDVIGTAAGYYENVSGYIGSTESGQNKTSTGYGQDTITVLAPPVISKSFGDTTILSGQTTTYTFTLTNPNAATQLTGVSFTDTYPGTLLNTGMLNITNNTCGVAPIASGGGGSFTLSGVTLDPGDSCTVTVDVTATTASTTPVAITDGTGQVTATGPIALTGNTPTATLYVKAYTPAISILKQVGTSATGPWSDSKIITASSNVYYRFMVENIGDVDFTSFNVTDPTLASAFGIPITCAWHRWSDNAVTTTLPAPTSPTTDPAAYCVVGPATAMAGQAVNTATAHGTTASLGSVDSDPDSAVYQNGNFGHLPSAYQNMNLYNDGGAFHLNGTTYFGASETTTDLDGINTPTYTFKSTDDGVTYTLGVNWFVGVNGGSLDITVACPGAPALPCFMNAWIDWNKDNDFNDTGEQIFTNYQFDSSGTFTRTFDIPAGTVFDGSIFYSRFRLYDQLPTSPEPNGQAYNGTAPLHGEIEDPFFRVTAGGDVTTPVTLSYFKASRQGSSVNFIWSTSTETGNVGFNLYVEEGGELVRVNGQMIPSHTIDSLDRQDYSYQANIDGDVYYIEDVDVFGQTRRHGPFRLGEAYGAQVEADKIDWSAIHVENKAGQNTRQDSLQPELSAAAGNPASLNLKVRQTGMYRVTYETLKTAGLDLTGVLSSRITLTNRGKAVPIYIKSVGKFGPGAYIEFYGQALDTLYTDTNVYTLQVSRTISSRIPLVNASPTRRMTPIGTYAETLKVENQRAYANYAPGTDAWYDTSMLAYKTSKSWDFAFQVDGLADSSSTATLELVVWGVTGWPQTPDHHLVVSLNGVQVANQTFDGLTEQKLVISLPAGVLQAGANNLQLTLPGDTGVDWDLVNLDKFSVTYTRVLQAIDGRLNFTAAGSAFKVTNLPSRDVAVYRITSAGAARLGGVQIAASGTTFTATFAGTVKPSIYLVTTVGGMYAPTLEVSRPTADLNRPAQYLIITHPNFINGIQPLVRARQAQGLTVSVVDVNDLYAQYSYSIFDPRAIQQYIAYAAQNLGTEYVLLVGGDTYDYRNYLGLNSLSFIPSLYVSTGPTVKSVPSDPLYADVNKDNIPDLAIGRFPVRTSVELDLIVNKTLAYAGKNYGGTAVFAADKSDRTVSFKNISNSLEMGLPSNWAVENIHLDDMSVTTARTQLISAMNRGTALVTYTGHSAPIMWNYSGLFTTNDAQALTNAGRPFVAVQWGCWNNYYVDPANNFLLQKLLFSGDQGAAVVLGATTLTNSSSDLMLGQLLTPRLVRPGMSIGWAVRDAKLELALTHPELLDVLLGWSLMGDPALVIQP